MAYQNDSLFEWFEVSFGKKAASWQARNIRWDILPPKPWR